MRVVCAKLLAQCEASPARVFARNYQHLKQLQRLADPACASIYTPTAVRNRCDRCEPRFRIAALLHTEHLSLTQCCRAKTRTMRRLLALTSTTLVCALAPSDTRPFLTLLDGSGSQRLPASMVDRFPTWLFDGAWQRVPDSDGFVNPHSCDDVWHASDLPEPAPRLCVGLHVRDGSLRHVFPAVDLDVDGYRNRGLKTVPRAHQWLAFSAALPMELNLYAGGHSYSATDTLGRVVEALATDAPDELGQGSHVIHAVVEGAPPLPPLLTSTEEQEARLVVYMADALFDDRDTAEVERAGILDVLVLETAAGSASEHLPAAYAGLFAGRSGG